MDNDYSWTTTPAEQRLRALELAQGLETCRGMMGTGPYAHNGIITAAEKFLEFLSPEPEASDDSTD